MSKIVKKIWKEYFQEILDGKKTYELRLADFECSSGDILVLREWDPAENIYTGRVVEKEVTYVGKTKGAEKFWSKEKIDKFGFQVISFK